MSKAASGQLGPKNPKGGKRIKRGRLHFTEEEVTRQTGAETSGQVGPKRPYSFCTSFSSGRVVIME